MQDQTNDKANILIAAAEAARAENYLIEAEIKYRDALSALEKTFGRDDARLLLVLIPLLELLKKQGAEAASVGIHERIKRLRRTVTDQHGF